MHMIYLFNQAMSQVRICRPTAPLIFAPIFMKDAHSAELNEKSFFLFLFFWLWLIVFTIYGEKSSLSPTKKKVVRKLPNLQESCALL